MAKRVVSIADKDSLTEAMRESHRERCRLGRQDKSATVAEMERTRRDGNELRVSQLAERSQEKSAAFMRRKRQIEQRELEQELARVGAAIRHEQRRLFKRQPPASLFKQFEREGVKFDGVVRDLYYDWIGRGFSSGKARNYTREAKRSSSRTTPWKSGEMGRKIRYIFRDAALEQVDGNTLTNMGDDIVEAVHCARIIEQLEDHSRDGAGVYHHVIVALPHELSPSERAQLLEDLVEPLRRLSLPFCAALHSPDKTGDQRNFHAHLVLSLRPMERVGSYAWEFATTKRTWLNTTAGIKLQRKFVSRSFNRALVAAGHEGRWTHMSRADRGEKSPGNTKKGAERTRADRAAEKAKKERRDGRVALQEANELQRELSRLAPAVDALDQCLDEAGSMLASLVPGIRGAIEQIGAELDGARASLENAKRIPKAVTPRPLPAALPPRASASLLAVEKAAGDVLVRADPGLSPKTVEAIREAVRSGGILTKAVNPGSYRVFAENPSLLDDWIKLIKTKAGQEYCREIIAELPEPDKDEVDLPSIKMTRATEPSDEIGLDVLNAMTRRGRGTGIS